MQIRYFNKKDSNQVSQLIKEVILDLPYYNDQAKRNELAKYCISNLNIKIKEDSKSIIVAEENDKIIGVCLSRFDDFTIWLEWILTSPLKRNNGVGKALIQKLEESTLDRNCHKIWCDCRTTNLISKKFLNSVGFDFITTITNHWYQQDFVLLQKSLNAQ